jgi:hypothetical protein
VRTGRPGGRTAARRAVLGWLLAPVALLVARPARATLDERDRARIQRLIEHVGRQSQIRFIRNGVAHDARQAAEHLQMKLDRASTRLTSVDEFIDQVASRSWLTGRPYLVRLPDGREVPAAGWLREELARIEARPQPPR